ncbi:ABC transporter permease [Granulosicoccus antarcticus]|uniref:Arginine ABC transporter permease protein ArtM n=1 Tax=Granulosicoccus antarcticus IMCC3135 TaxID=1192854 RepID=A0A2Z2NR54_9GAMM|nr:ABC transporter permease [Granulosicoccus antarcticus]ASJ72481.1 Octopine transport system permease protein OccM [Granulosicoccus antarcticus IMCC3135]
MQWAWVAEYFPNFIDGIVITLKMLGLSIAIGMALAIPIGLVQVTGPRWLAMLARAFCTIIRGTPLLIQLWLLYYGLGSLFPLVPEIRNSFLWPLLRDAFPYAVLAFSLSVAGYEGEIMRGAFKGVPKGELEAARAFGMSRFTLLRRIWLPRALQNVLPTLAGEFVLTLKATPLAATITVFDVYGVGTLVRQETYRVYEPLLVVAGIYLCLTALIVLFFRWLEQRIPRPA